MRNQIVVGSRKSKLALIQTQIVIAALQKYYPKTQFKIQYVTTEGDRNLQASLTQIGGKGVFVKEIEQQLLDHQIDLAVHSLKDVLPVLPEQLTIGAYPQRDCPFDCLISRQPLSSIWDLPEHSIIGTSSSRRQSQLLHQRPDLRVVSIRGNLDSRLHKIATDNLDGIIVAQAGLNRLQPRIQPYYVLNLEDIILPAVGQGCLAVECRQQDLKMRRMLQQINDTRTELCVEIEREFLRELGGDCTFPIGGYARVVNQELTFTGLIATNDGQHLIQAETRTTAPQLQIGRQLAQKLRQKDQYQIIQNANVDDAAL